MILVQLCWSTTSLLPNTYVGSVNLSAMEKTKAADKLNAAYAETTVPVYFTDSNEIVVQPTLSDLGYTINNDARVDKYSYPFLARLVPFSLFVYQAFMPKGDPEVTRDTDAFTAYMNQRFGVDCQFKSVDGTIAYTDGALKVVDASRGGSCDVNDLQQKLQAVTARLDQPKVTVSGTSTAPEITTETAQKEYDRLMADLNNGVELKVQNKTDHIDKSVVEPWIVYSTANGVLNLSIKGDEASAWLTNKYGKEFTYPAGTTVVTVKDYAESSRETGKSGSALNTDKTVAAITQELQDSKATALLVADTIQPAVQYNRTFSPADPTLSSVMKNYANSHPGTYGVKMIELSGARRNASYDSTTTFTTASTYKLFVAYSILLRIERGEIKWTDPSFGGQSVSTCFNRMLQLSDNDCAVWFLLKVSYDGVNVDAHAIGAIHTNFNRNTGITSTPDDEAQFLAQLYTGQILGQQASRDRFISTMKGNVYVAGIPTGIPNADVADKVGFMDDLLHDAAIVYSKKGDYVLIIMTSDASWANIAELAGDIEAAR
jgi:beta-lactamase class A